MKVAFQKWGNSLALRVPKAFADEIGASDGRAAEMTVSNGKRSSRSRGRNVASPGIPSTSWLRVSRRTTVTKRLIGGRQLVEKSGNYLDRS